MKPVIVALDTPSIEEAKQWIAEVAPFVGAFKVGLELLTAHGVPTVLHELIDVPIIVDLKLHDIPNTIGAAVKALRSFTNVFGVTVHASSGVDGMRAAVDAAEDAFGVIVVTVLTSLSESDCLRIYRGGVTETVAAMAGDAVNANVKGLVCSPQELDVLVGNVLVTTEGVSLFTPGVRPTWASTDDQARVMTPGDAITRGATAVIVGRPITRPPALMHRAQAAELVLGEVLHAQRTMTNRAAR